MTLSKEWLNRITHWTENLWKLCFEPLSTFELLGFVTQKQLTPVEATQHKFHPMPVGTRWGRKWQYGWFVGKFSLPSDALGKRIVMRMNPASKTPENGECLVWVNGRIIGSYSWARQEITLTLDGVPGASYSILVEAYAGNGPLITGGGPVLFGHESVPEVSEPQVVVSESSFGIWHEQVYQLSLDFATLVDLRNHLDSESLRVAEIDQGLKDVTYLLDLEQPISNILISAEKARARILPLLDSVNSSTMPTFYAFGHAHIDVAWLWPMEETERKIARTIINQLSLMEEYQDYCYLQSQPQLYVLLQNRYPDLYECLKQAVLSGRVIPEGAMWVEADTNITGGESLIRQIMYAKQFFKDEFGMESVVLWLPDVFGYSGALPQVLAGCGINSFATQKISWTYHGGDPFPYNTFLWEGIDGTTIPTHIFADYNSHTHPSDLINRWNNRLQKDGINSMLLSFGWGDGGGGPTRDHLEYLSRVRDLEGVPRVKLASPAEFFEDLKLHGLPKERYVGELYFQAHRGTYTSQARTKQGNRRAEFALREAEFWGCIANLLKGYHFSNTSINSSWKKLLTNQFHDILPGSSINRVYKEAELVLNRVVADATHVASQAASLLTKKSAHFTLFNSLSWERTVLVNTPQGSDLVTVPACGWKSINPGYKLDTKVRKSWRKLIATKTTLENDVLRARINPRGELTSLVDKESGIEMLSARGNRFCLYQDVPSQFDAWDIDSMTENLLIATNEPGKMEITNLDEYQAVIKLERKLSRSTITQLIKLQRGSYRIDFETTIDWQERHKLLKVLFPVNIHANEAFHEIQFGYIRRPNHRSRPYDADRFEVCNHKWSALVEEDRGVAILNDSKYGISILGNNMQLSLLKSALAPDPFADNGIHKFTYSIFYWTGSFFSSRVIQEAYELNSPVLVVPGSAGNASIFQLSVPNIVLETLKLAEDGSCDLILRMYESKHAFTKCELSTTLPLANAYQTDMLENERSELALINNKIMLEFRPFEIKTLRLTIDMKKPLTISKRG